ncbi:MAG: hypothetical protein LC104_13590 [Bacteroidales bacterium]|nr:hypothetical protein [Bacteroidales bacterium]
MAAQTDRSSLLATPSRGEPAPRRWGKRCLHLLRRVHLYLGLFLLPWAVLYGITGFLFNHPTAFSDQNTASFRATAIAGSPLLSAPSPVRIAEQVIAGLNARAPSPNAYSLVEPEAARYAPRTFAFATATLVDGRKVSLLFDVVYGSGTVREQAVTPPIAPTQSAPFAIRSGGSGNMGRTGRGSQDGSPRTPAAEPLIVPEPLHEHVLATIPAALTATGFPQAVESVVTSVPDLIFHMQDQEGQIWRVNFNAKNGTVAGTLAEQKPATEPLSLRRFLLRLHLIHGYPSEGGAKWWWAVIVDVMSFVMVFWGISGMMMWWQIKATRWIGIPIIILSAVTATVMTMGMYAYFTSP